MKLLSVLSLALFGLIAGLTACSGTSAVFGKSISASNSSGGNASVLLNWTASAGSPVGYYVEKSSDGVNFTQVASTTGTSTTVSGLSTGSTYYFRIRAYNQGGDSSYTSVTSVTIPVPSPSPSAS